MNNVLNSTSNFSANIGLITKVITSPEFWGHALHTGNLFDQTQSSQNLIIFRQEFYNFYRLYSIHAIIKMQGFAFMEHYNPELISQFSTVKVTDSEVRKGAGVF